jgi:fumarate reductase flavoprotein subunit
MTEANIRKGLGRRDFIKRTAAGAGVLSLGGLNSKMTDAAAAQTEWDREADVVIIGAGGAGLCASIEASNLGAHVILVERMPIVGGNTMISGSAIIAGGTSIQKAAGVQDSPDKLFRDAIEDGRLHYQFTKKDTKVLRVAYDSGPDLIDWLTGLGVQFLEKPSMHYSGIPRFHYLAPGYRKGSPVLINRLQTVAANKGASILLETKLTKLLVEPNSSCPGGRIIGVAANDSKGKLLHIKAKRGVVLASGGFARGTDMIKRYHPYLSGIRALGTPGCTGEATKAALEVGASMLTEYVDYGVETLFVGTQKGYSAGAPLRIAPLVVVNKEGKRFIDETQGYSPATKKMMGNGYKVAYLIFDDGAKKEYESAFRPIIENDVVKAFSSVDDLAVQLGVNASQLLKTINNYNSDVEKGKDREFGRTNLLKKIEVPPIYAFEAEPAIYVTYGGLEINGLGQVLTASGQPIPGLYAAGEVCGSLAPQVNCRYAYLGGLAQCLIFGRIAGRNAAMLKP